MLSENAKVAVIIGHPAHELRIHRFLELYKPIVYVLTDGSGGLGMSRVHNTIKVIEQTGSTVGPVMGRFTDEEMYNIILRQDTSILEKLALEILEDLQKHSIDFIVGDSIEGHSPTHDLCRYMVNAIAKIYSIKQNKEIPNYDFLLVGPPNACPPELEKEALWIKLTEEDFERKYQAALNYPEVFREMEYALKEYGPAPFKIECLRPVKEPEKYDSWNGPLPWYENDGIEKVKEGKYSESISYAKHLLPLGKFFSSYAELLISK